MFVICSVDALLLGTMPRWLRPPVSCARTFATMSWNFVTAVPANSLSMPREPTTGPPPKNSAADHDVSGPRHG